MDEKVSNLETFIELRDIHVSFGQVQVLKGINLKIKAGETLALLGANGAGKSTLMNVLTGKIQHYEGEIRLGDQEVVFHSPVAAMRAGIGMVQQDLGLIPDLTGYENIMLGHEITRGGLYDREANLKNAIEVLKKLSANVSLECPVSQLSPSKQQLISIARSLVRTPKLLILDEPTSMITAADIRHLMDVIHELQRQKVAIIFISHKLNEVYESCDRVAVIREGKVVGQDSLESVSEEQIITWMVGAAPSEYQKQIESFHEPKERCLLSANKLGNKHIKNISLKVHEGEIVGLIGLVGSGRSEILRALAGIDAIDCGNIEVESKPIKLGSPQASLEAGILLVPEDRARAGLFIDQGLGFNALIYHPSRYSKWGFLGKHSEQLAFEECQNKNQAKADSYWQKARTLSGGNQQRLMLGKTLLREPLVLLLDEITAGVDISTKMDCLRKIRLLAAEGLGVIYTSSQWDEVTDVADRLYIVSEGEIVGVSKRGEATHGDFMKLIWGGGQSPALSREGHYG